MVSIIKRRSQWLSSQKDTLLKKSYEIAIFCDVDVALFLRMRKTSTFNSLDLESWPPSKEQMVVTKVVVQTIRKSANREL